MTDELYINGTRVDISPESGIYLDYESGILSDLDSISANYSYSIKLPKTGVNMQVIDGLFFPTSESAFPTAKNTASLYRDGVAIVEGATVNLLEVNQDEIEISLSWGVADVLSAIDEVDVRGLYGNETVKAGEGYNILLYPYRLQSGARDVPAVAVSDVLGRINDAVQSVITFPAGFTADMGNYYVPVLLRKKYEKEESRTGLLVAQATGLQHVVASDRIHFDANNVGYPQYVAGESYTSGIIFDTSQEPATGFAWSINVLEESRFELTATIQYVSDATPPTLYIRNGGRTMRTNGDVYYSSVADAYAITPLHQGNDWLFYVYDNFKGNMHFYLSNDIELTSFHIDFWSIGEEAEEEEDNAEDGEDILLSRNLPDISCKDFLKGVCGLYGCFPLLVGDMMALVRYDDIYNGVYGTYDWSDKLLQTCDVPDAMEMSSDSLYQRNRFVFANDEDVPETGAMIGVNNRALEEEGDLVSVAFNGTWNTDKGLTGEANIPIYEEKYDNDTGALSWEMDDDEDCYICYSDDGTVLYARTFTDYLSEFYQDFPFLIAGRVITERFELDPIDLKELDMRKVVYLRQYGCNFALMEVKTKANYAEVKLLALQ